MKQHHDAPTSGKAFIIILSSLWTVVAALAVVVNSLQVVY